MRTCSSSALKVSAPTSRSIARACWYSDPVQRQGKAWMICSRKDNAAALGGSSWLGDSARLIDVGHVPLPPRLRTLHARQGGDGAVLHAQRRARARTPAMPTAEKCRSA
eukprot:6196221-Pleurochrysis_carterae.AAC.2